jgi:hypothetical protein
MAPERQSDLAQVAFRAFVAGSAACFMTACIAGEREKVDFHSIIHNYRITIGTTGTLISSVSDTAASTTLAPSTFTFTPNMTALF